jgi:ribonuclease Z
MIEVVFLGVGAALPMRGQTNCAYLVRGEGMIILIDCGPAILQQLAAAGLTPGEVTHLFVTHRHGDHALGYPMFLLWWALQRPAGAPLPTVLAGQLTWLSLEKLALNSYGDLTDKVADLPRIAFPDGESFSSRLGDGVMLRTWPMEHSRFAPVSGVRLEIGDKVIAFTSDTAPCDNTVPLARGANLLVHDAAYSETLNPELAGGAHGHSTARGAGKIAAAAGAKRLALVHLDARYEGQEEVFLDEAAREFAGPIQVPSAGVVITV